MESFFASPKKVSAHGASFAPSADARAELFEDIEVFCCRGRRHSALGYLTPGEFERAA